jgi:hypothetical protein
MDNNERGQSFQPLPFNYDFAVPAEWAAMYRQLGLQAVPAKMPVRDGEWKMPALASWAEFQENLIPQATFDRWYGSGGEHANRQNMGILTGRCSGNVFVIDLDDQKGPEAQAWWHGLIELHNNGIDIETVEQRTGGGGRQKLFRAPMDWLAPTNKTAIHIDVRGQGGFAMMPGSMHESGRCYEWMPGCAPWEIEIATAPEWLLEAIDTLIVRHGSRPRIQHTASPETRKNAFGTKIIEGRESYMRDMIWRVVLDWYRLCPVGPPPAAESTAKMEEAWAVYEDCVGSRLPPEEGVSNADLLERENRGHSLFANKWRRELKNWGSPKMSREANIRTPSPQSGHSDRVVEAVGQSGVLEYLDVRQIKSQPDPVWMIDGLVNEQSLGFIFGPPGSLKTFLALDIALSTTAKLASWWGRSLNQHGAVIYLCREGVASLKFRIMAWEQHRQAKADNAPFYLIRKNLNFMNPADVAALIATVAEIVGKVGPVRAVFVDTVSRVLPGAKENQQEDMSLFIGACDALQQRFGCVVIGVHHTNKNGGIRGSTVIPGAGDFLIETRREPGSMTGSIVLQKIKDGEDGQEIPFKVTKVELPGIVPRSSLMVDPATEPAKREAGPSWPDTAICREILAVLDDQWRAGKPWCFATNSPRSATTNIMKRWRLKREVVKDILETWNANGVIEESDFDSKNHIKGYRKLTGF